MEIMVMIWFSARAFKYSVHVLNSKHVQGYS